MNFDKTKPYNELPLLPPSQEIETKQVLKKTVLAREALGRLAASNKRLPNDSVLINAILIQEAKISSEIENIVTTNDDLYKALASETKNLDPYTKEVLRYPPALWAGYRYMKERGILNIGAFVTIVNTIKENTSGIRVLPGTTIKNPVKDEIVYTPPEGEAVILNKLKNVEEFLNTTHDNIDLLVKMALIHYQFEAVHPFYDGNGRTGRIINILCLIMHGLLDKPVLYLSKYILENKNEYYRRIKAVTEEAKWEDWVLYMLEAVEQTAKHTEKKIDDICQLMDTTADKLKKEAPHLYSKELLEVLFSLPYSKRKFLVDAGIVQEKTAGRYLAELEKIGLLRQVKAGREKLYVNKQFYDLLKS